MNYVRFKNIVPEAGKNTYLVSHFGGAWFVHHYDGTLTLVASTIESEREATDIAMILARRNRPSQVRKMVHGEAIVIRTFFSNPSVPVLEETGEPSMQAWQVPG